MQVAQQLLNVSEPNSTADPVVHHILSGSFRSLSLFLLAFSPLQRTLSLVQKVDAFGPHQYLATNQRRDRVYTTSWALPPVLSSWEVEHGAWRVNHINSVPITATSSYVSIPPPFAHACSAGGPTGEVHVLDPVTGGFGEKLQQILFVPEDKLEEADKTRVALRYGSHAVEFSASGHAFIPVLGTDTIEMYTRDVRSGFLTHLASIPSPHGSDTHDGPRHLKIHPNGKVLYCVTEHTNFVDSYIIHPDTLTHMGTRSLLPTSITPEDVKRFRGDTLSLAPPTSLHPAPRVLFATTRGSTTSQRGWLSFFKLDEDGMFTEGDEGAEYWETPTSGGKANAIDVIPKNEASKGESVWMLLTDDDDSASGAGGGGVRVLEWDGWGKSVRVVVGWPALGENLGTEGGEPKMKGGSHAIWLD